MASFWGDSWGNSWGDSWGSVAAGTTDDLSAANLLLSSGILGNPDLTLKRLLDALDLVTGSFDAGSPDFVAVVQFVSAPLEGREWELGQPDLLVSLATAGLVSGEIDLGTPALSPADALLAAGIVAGVPLLADSSFGQEHVLTAGDLLAGASCCSSWPYRRRRII